MSKIALITGASRGIGKAISLKLIAEGYRILGIARKFDWQHPQLDPLLINLSDLQNLERKLKEIRLDRLDAVICNAGKGKFGFLEQLSFSQICELMNLNFLSHVLLIKTFLPFLKKQQKGDVVLIGSESGLAGKRQGSIYSATKFALRGFCQSLREECSTSHVRISLVNPGMTKTDFFDDLSFAPGAHASEHILPEDVAEIVSFILSSRVGTVFDEINLSPQKKNINFKN